MPHTIVCLSSQPWHDPLWTNKQHLMRRIARRHRVVFVDPLETRVEPIRGATGLRAVVDALVSPVERETDGVTVLTFRDPTARLRSFVGDGALARTVALELRVRTLGRYLASRGVHAPIAWVYDPSYGAGVTALAPKLVVYDCVDDYGAFPEHVGDPTWIRERERALCRVADRIFTTSPALFEARSAERRPTFLVPNVGDAAHFSAARSDQTPVPRDVADLPRPVVGFVGAVSGYKVDLGALLHLALRRPAWSVVLIGPVGVADPSTDVSRLARTPNVHLLGHRAYAELPGYVKGIDVAVVPYRDSAYTRACFPIKFFDLMATGKPLVVSDLPALRPFHDLVHVARGGDELVAACERALAGPDTTREERIALAHDNTWEHRVERLLALVDEALAGG